MKSAVVAILFLLCYHFSSANIYTVSNNIYSPGQYNQIQPAVDAAYPGDTILVTGAGSGSLYNETRINKKLCIFGQGFYPQVGINSSTCVRDFYFDAGSSGSLIMGFSFERDLTATENITVTRNRLRAIFITSNCKIFNNLLSTIEVSGNDNLIYNNIMLGGLIRSRSTTITGNKITNNLITGAIELYNAIIANNIFYWKNADPTIAAYIDATYSVNNSINNNIYFNSSVANPLSLGINNNTGTGNLNVNPLFINFDLTTPYDYTPNENYQLQANSPAKNAGIDGKDIGCYGGANPLQFPFTGEPSIPQIRSINLINSVIPPTGTLRVNVKAKANN